MAHSGNNQPRQAISEMTAVIIPIGIVVPIGGILAAADIVTTGRVLDAAEIK